MVKSFGVLFFLLILVFASGCNNPAEEKREGTEKNPVPVEVQAVAKESLEKHQKFSGEVDSHRNVSLTAGVNGEVYSINVKTGDRVEKGQLLVELKNEELLAQVRQADASLEQARASYISTREHGIPRRVRELENVFETAEIEYNSAYTDYERMKELYEAGAVARTEYDGARTRYEGTESRFYHAKDQLEMEKQATDAELAVIRAQVSQAEAGAAAARTVLDNLRLEAPFSGTVSVVDVTMGEKISPGAPLITLVDFDRLYVALELTERSLAYMREGTEVGVKVPGAGFEGEGTVEEVALTPRPGGRSYSVKVFFRPDIPLQLCVHADLLVPLKSVEEAVVIPRRALLEEEDDFYAFTVEDGVALKRPLELGIMTGESAEVIKGLKEGEELVVRGQHYLEDGERVEVRVGGGRA